MKQLNTLLNVYIENNTERRLRKARKAIDWLKKESEDLESKMMESESSLQSFRRDKEVVDFSNQREENIILNNFYDLNHSYISTKKERLVLEVQIVELKKYPVHSVDHLEEINTMSNDPSIISLERKYNLRFAYFGN